MPGASNNPFFDGSFFQWEFAVGATALNHTNFATLLNHEHLKLINSNCFAVSVVQIDEPV
jgi:hypothetical protein